ncbi:MAG: hypothetical protein BVN35_20525 [Proteobacteria bacterium ST_bin11]|nr:MAG: hypothetical protein BVN35_20525 [Proteobacteria bacterium ST_bin11]
MASWFFSMLFRPCLPAQSKTAAEKMIDLDESVEKFKLDCQENIDAGRVAIEKCKNELREQLEIVKNPRADPNQANCARARMAELYAKIKQDEEDVARYSGFLQKLESTQNTVIMGEDAARVSALETSMLDSSTLTRDAVQRINNQTVINRERRLEVHELLGDVAPTRGIFPATTLSDEVEARRQGLTLQTYRDSMPPEHNDQSVSSTNALIESVEAMLGVASPHSFPPIPVDPLRLVPTSSRSPYASTSSSATAAILN